MAVVSPTFTKRRGQAGGIDAVKITWTGIGDADTCKPVSRPDLADRSVQVEGTFGGATIVLQGSNDATSNSDGNYRTLNDPAAAAISLTSAGIKQVTEATDWIKPATSGGTGSSITVTVLARRSVR